MADTKTSVVIQARVDGLASVKNLESGLTSLGNKADTVGGKFQKFNGLLKGLGGAIAAAGIGRILGNASEVAAGFETETRLLEQGLRNVGAGTGELERLQGVADKLGKATLFNEEDFRQGFGLLTSFGNIGTENYEKVATAAANVAQVSGTDVSSAFMQLAKALNDPVAGLSALSRSGIQFTEQQKELIKGLVESGNVVGAQTMILKELEAQYGGTAVAAAGGAAGVKDTFGEAMYDLNVAIGSVVNTALPPLLTLLTNVVNAFAALPGPIQTIVVAIGGLGSAALLLAPLVTAFGAIGQSIAGIGPLLSAISSAIGVVVTALTGSGGLLAALAAVFTGPVGWVALLAAAGAAIYVFRDEIGEAIGAVVNFFKGLGQTFMQELALIGQLFMQLPQTINDNFIQPAIELFSTWSQFVGETFTGALQLMNDTFVQPALQAWQGFTQSVQEIIQGIYNFIVNNFIQPAMQAWQSFVGGIGEAFTNITQTVSDAMRSAYDFVVNTFIRPTQQAFSNVVGAIAGGFRSVYQAIVGPIQQAYSVVVNIVNGIINAVNSAISAIMRMLAMGGGGGGGAQAAAEGAYWPGGFTPFAKGGMVTGPTLGLVGEAGPEYIVPAHKATRFAENILAGVRGPAAIPRFAEGGFVSPSANVSIQTGPVTQMNGTNYVTTQDLSRAVQSGVNQTLSMIASDGRVRRQLGLA